MKTTSSIAVCVLVVLVHQLQASTAQEPVEIGPAEDKPRCSSPFCGAGTLDQWKCRCFNEEISKSICPKGFTEIVNNLGLCSCERKSNPTCPKGARFDIKSCTCDISQKPTCPAGSSIIPHSALCTGTAKPTCPTNAVLHPLGCRCVMEYLRQCPNGGQLSRNGCECRGLSDVTTPLCSRGCVLSEKGCRCQSIFIDDIKW